MVELGVYLSYSPRADATAETELDALASVYAFVLRCGEARRAEGMKNAADVTSTDGGDDGERKVRV
jgi:hypothetical protein